LAVLFFRLQDYKVFIDVLLLVLSIQELLEPDLCGQFGVEETKGTLPRCHKSFAVHKRVKLKRERIYIIQMALAVSAPSSLVGYPLIALEA
jgi:hypothetical protein